MEIIRSSLIKVIFILVLITLISPLTEAESVTVTAEAEITAGAELARREALQSAFLKAVRQTAGSYIEQSTLVENSKLISQRIFSKAEGYVKSYQILEESAAAGVYQLRLKAEVTSRLFSDLEELQLVIETQTSNPRILLLLEGAQPETLSRRPVNQFQAEIERTEQRLGAAAAINEEAAEIQQNFRAGLKELGFELAAAAPILNALRNPVEWQQEAQALLEEERQPFELLITGEHNLVKLGEKNFSSGTLIIQGLESSFAVYSAQTGEKLQEIQFTEKAYARDAARASTVAIKKMKSSAAQRLAAELMPLISLNSGQKRLKLKVNNLANFEDLKAFEEAIKKLAGIQSFKLQSFGSGAASYLLKVLQSSAVLAERFQNEKDFPLEVLELGPDYLELKAN